MKKRRLKKGALAKLIIGTLMIGGIIFFVVQINKEVNTTFSLLADLRDAEEQLKQLQQEKEYLINQKEKLNDENYIESVARGKYLITKEGEQVFVLPPLGD